MSVNETTAAWLAAGIPNILRALDEEMGEDFSQPARLLFWEASDEGVTFGIKELKPGQHPLDELLGYVPPETWDALGAVCHGWASADTTTRPSRAADRFRIRSVHVVVRDGREFGGFRPMNGQLELQERALGMVPDALRRAMGLPTPPPETHANWDDLRWEVAMGTRHVPGLSPSVAAWMDAGMFSRWMTD